MLTKSGIVYIDINTVMYLLYRNNIIMSNGIGIGNVLNEFKNVTGIQPEINNDTFVLSRTQIFDDIIIFTITGSIVPINNLFFTFRQIVDLKEIRYPLDIYFRIGRKKNKRFAMVFINHDKILAFKNIDNYYSVLYADDITTLYKLVSRLGINNVIISDMITYSENTYYITRTTKDIEDNITFDNTNLFINYIWVDKTDNYNKNVLPQQLFNMII